MGIIIIGLIVLIIGFFMKKSNSVASKFHNLIKLGGLIIIIVGILITTIRQINPGQIAVQVLFGKVENKILYEGLNFVNPLIDLTIFSTQTQNYTMSSTNEEGHVKGDDAIRVLSKDGLEVIIDMTVLYRLIPSEAPQILQKIGADYEDKVIRPTVRSRIRESSSYFDAIDLYSLKRDAFEANIKGFVDKDFAQRGFVLEQLLVRKINLPTSVKESIERKITANQESQRMKYVLEKELQEAERKRVEAKGVADAQKIINEGLSDRILQFEMIKVQKELVNSQNSKIILLGNGKNTPPFIIGDGK